MTNDNLMLQAIRNLLFFLTIIAVLFVMNALASILLPLVVAIMVTLLYEPLFQILHKRKIPSIIITPFLAIITITILVFVIQIFIDSTQAIYADRVELGWLLKKKILSILNYFDEIIPLQLDDTFLQARINQLLSESSITNFAGSSISALSSFGSSFFMFSLYFLILLFSMPGYESYINYIAGDDKKFLKHARNIQNSIGTYMTVKFFVSVITGSIALIVCLIFGIKYAPFWAFVTFSLNFIPTIGSIIATLLPTLMAVIQFDSWVRVVLLFSILFGVQMLMGNIIEPRIMGKRLRLNTVTIIFGLVFWSFIWGIPGAFLSVPLLVIVKIFLQNNESLKFISRIMGKADS
ncbi:MAG: AI-2E family transporter [Spirochaetales bacterium]|nr:AI-2E family transporter [Spirochaetales bacterium]